MRDKKCPKLLLYISTIAFTFFIIALFAVVMHIPNKKGRYSGYIEYTIECGDTYWGIARRYIKHGDIRIYISDIKEFNVPAEELYPGDVIRIPLQ